MIKLQLSFVFSCTVPLQNRRGVHDNDVVMMSMLKKRPIHYWALKRIDGREREKSNMMLVNFTVYGYNQLFSVSTIST